MNALPLATLATAILIAASSYPAPVNAGTGLQRCQAEDGSVMYTDKACGALGVTATPIPGELQTRIAYADAMSTDPETTDASARTGQAHAGRRSLAGGCARTPTQLAMDLRGAFALGDLNRIAESYHWTGLSHKQGQRIMARLGQFADKRISDVHYFNAQVMSSQIMSAQVGTTELDGDVLADAANTPPGNTGNAGVMQVTFGAGASTSMNDFEVEKYSDCYFIRF